MFARSPLASGSIDQSPLLTTYHQTLLPSSSPLSPSPTTEIISAELVDELEMQAPVTGSNRASQDQAKLEGCFADHLTKAELETVRKYIAQTSRPSWHRGPPNNINAPGAGKLKADQWRSCIEFDLVVAVARLYSPSTCKNPNPSAAQRCMKLFEATMNLALAIQCGTSMVTSTAHSSKYAHCMHSYLRALLDLYPECPLLPNHHAALHIPEFLLRFGPSPGWWMFPYERLIGRLQAINTNNKMGKRSHPLSSF